MPLDFPSPDDRFGMQGGPHDDEVNQEPVARFNDSIYPLVVWLAIVTSRDEKWQESSPGYLLEKSHILSLDSRDAWGFGYLDVQNMRRAVEYLQRWHLPIPEPWREELRLQLQAAEEWAREQKANDQLAA